MRKAFSLAEMMATVMIIGILATMMVVFIPDYTKRTADIANKGTVEILNKALELYKIEGGIKLSHSLNGPNINTSAGNSAIFTALKNGFTQGGVRMQFIDGTFKLSPNSVIMTGSGPTAAFTLGTPPS